MKITTAYATRDAPADLRAAILEAPGPTLLALKTAGAWWAGSVNVSALTIRRTPSDTRAGVFYWTITTIRPDTVSGQHVGRTVLAWCACLGWQNHRKCKHVRRQAGQDAAGDVLSVERQRAIDARDRENGDFSGPASEPAQDGRIRR